MPERLQSLRRPRLAARGLLALAALSVLFAVPRASAQETGDARLQPVHKASHVISSDDLVVEIMDPEGPDRYYEASRFTNVAAVLRVTMGEDGFFFNPVGMGANPWFHAGLAAEFGSTTVPPGFGDAEDRGPFLKIGVGILQKRGEQYDSNQLYRILEPAATTVTWNASSAEFRQTAALADRYAYELSATVRAEGADVIVDWALKNTGSEAFETDHFSHNFFSLGDAPIGPGYAIAFPYDFEAGELDAELEQVGREIRFLKRLRGAPYFHIPYPEDYDGPNEVTVYHTGNGLKIRCLTSEPGTRTSIFSMPGMLCPEQFIAFPVSPGETKTFRRTYSFSKEPAS